MSTDNLELLDKIQYPDDLRKLPIEQLPELCAELRQDIVKELSVNPGHLASSLGVVELTVALHYVLNTPYDRIVWDVGHQAYGHKILTGRKDQFYTNRKLGGIRPFPSPKESEYDTFTCGHASNSISVALGMAVAAHKNNDTDRHVVAVIGDGAMSGGLAFEGLNNVSSSPNDLLIILNDNDMSIDHAVGGMEKYLLNLDTNATYNRLRDRASKWLHSKGYLNDDRRKGLIRLNNAIKSALAHQQNIFEGMNIRYFGPFDGNNVVELVRILNQLKDMRGPKLLHLHTVKGKGYKPAEEAATIWHAPGKFDPDTGERLTGDTSSQPLRYQDVFGRTIIELAKQNPKIVGVTPAIERVKKLFGAEYANVQPHSGAQANAAVLLAVLKPGDTFLGLNLAHGGHLSHGSAVNTSGILYHAIGYDLDQETGRVNYDQMEQLALEHKPKLIIGGGSAYSREWDYKRMREIADKVGALLMIDMAHPAGLIAAGLLDNPVKYAHIVTSTTHKTLRGPRGGIILMGKDFENPWGLKTPKGVTKMMSQLLNSAVFPGQQGGPLEHVIAAKAVAFGEALQPEFKEWAKQVKKNASVLADELIKRGFTIVSGGTDNHSMLVDLRSKYPDLTGKVAENALVAADITVNKNMVPYDTRSAFQTSGIRLGTPAITTRGAKEDLMVLIAELIEEVLNDPENEEVIARVRAKVNETMKDYPLFAY